MNYKNIEVEEDGRVFTIRINRPEVLNCIDPETNEELFEAWKTFRDDDDLWVAIITGTDRAFCTGADLKAWHKFVLEQRVNFPRKNAYYGPGFGGLTRGMEIFKPIIAAINGLCYAGGLEIALAADIRICSENARFGVLNRRWNVGLGDGGTQRLWRVVGLGRAMELILTGKEIDAEEAYRIGLVNEVVPAEKLLKRAKEVARRICSFPQGSVRMDKEAVIRGIGRPIEEGVRVENLLFWNLLLNRDFFEGPAAFRDKREAEFTNESEKLRDVLSPDLVRRWLDE
ncbi:enoyl-CoA hydratase/isomerase family protein [Archaeoglobus fulgidus]|nr:enoyl-CoA hydratase/isomerase family protein [Archaeoglobus fulgidus]AIG97563.1 Enoyl-CoA hydratase/carnithine racemase [Archaeoglobus fulgidus DSM 8774]KUJ94272.1 MAG: Enoyl-CoA hydratase (Fad-2) [Archaeoglobus fulgidus]KUK07547.1 MAG: Enoyl-CoA hydratase (Fad-2) [Archaeoglobus fulgidus]